MHKHYVLRAFNGTERKVVALEEEGVTHGTHLTLDGDATIWVVGTVFESTELRVPLARVSSVQGMLL